MSTAANDRAAPVGRDAEHAALLAFLRRLHVGPGALLVTGDAGIGKTTVLQAGLDAARELGHVVLACRTSAAEVRLSFVGLCDLLDGVLGDVLPGLAEPQERALAAALGRADANSPADARLLGLALLNVLRRLGSERPVVVAIDDLQWLDPPSADGLAFALRRLRDEPVGLLASVRGERSSPAPFELDRELSGRLERLALGPLSFGALQRMLHERLEAPLPRPVVRRIYERSAGNPFYALELARAFVERGDERLPESLRNVVSSRIERLPDATRTLLVLLAAAAHPTLSLVDALGVEGALEPAEREGVIVLDDRRIRFTHPLLAAAVQDGATGGEMRAAHRRLAAVVDDEEQRARHLALTAVGPAEEIAAALDEAVARALARGAPGAAAELADQALALTPPKDRGAIYRRQLEAARRWRTVGNSARQRALLEQAFAAAASKRERAEPLWQLAALAGDEGDGAAARALIRDALRDADGDSRLSAEISVDAIWLEGGLGGALEPAEAALKHAQDAGDAMLEAVALSAVAHASFSHGLGYRRELFERALELERTAGFIDAARRPTTRYGLTAKWAGDIPLARQLLEDAAARAHEDDDASATVVLYYLSWLHLIAGEWQRSLERADEAQQLARDAGRAGDAAAALVTRAVVEAHLGRLGDAAEHLDDTRALAQDAETGFPHAYAVPWAWGAAVVACSSGQPERAVDQLGPVLAALRRRGLDEPGYHPWFPTYADALIRADRIDEAEEAADWFETGARQLERRWALAMSAHVRGALAATRGDLHAALHALERALERHEGVGRPFDQAWTLLLYGQTLRRSKRRKQARETLTESLRRFEQLGAAVWAERTRAELERIGGRPASDGLTETERRIAGLVAEGKSNKQVAAELFVTVRTVETNLSRIYAKLGLRSRGELAAYLSRAQ